MYALVALGYTFVYGIIELINFAHGDLFMLGTIFSANFMVELAGLRQAGRRSILALVLTFVVTMVVLPGDQHGCRVLRLPAIATCARNSLR